MGQGDKGRQYQDGVTVLAPPRLDRNHWRHGGTGNRFALRLRLRQRSRPASENVLIFPLSLPKGSKIKAETKRGDDQ